MKVAFYTRLCHQHLLRHGGQRQKAPPDDPPGPQGRPGRYPGRVRLLRPDPPGGHGRPVHRPGGGHRRPGGLCRPAGTDLAGAPAHHRPGQRHEPPPFRGPARRRAGGPHPCHAEGGGRLRELLHLLHHPLCPWAHPLPSSGRGQGPGRPAGGRGLSGAGAHRHRDLLLGPGTEGWLLPHRPHRGRVSGRPGLPHPTGVAGAPDHHRRVLPPGRPA